MEYANLQKPMTVNNYEKWYKYGKPNKYQNIVIRRCSRMGKIEFKETWNAETSLKTICAFDNDMDSGRSFGRFKVSGR